MAASVNDPRAVRTRGAILDAFAQMASEMDLDKITVKGIAERAGINRKTFYLHFETLEALFDHVTGSIMDEFFECHETTPHVPEDIDGHAQRFFLFLAEQSPVTEKLICSPSYYDFGNRIYRTQMSRYREAGDPFSWMGAAKEELVLSFIRNTALDFYRQWIAGGKAVPKGEAAVLLGELTCRGVEALMRPTSSCCLAETSRLKPPTERKPGGF